MTAMAFIAAVIWSVHARVSAVILGFPVSVPVPGIAALLLLVLVLALARPLNVVIRNTGASSDLAAVTARAGTCPNPFKD